MGCLKGYNQDFYLFIYLFIYFFIIFLVLLFFILFYLFTHLFIFCTAWEFDTLHKIWFACNFTNVH